MMQQAMSGLEQAQLQQALAQLGLNNLPLVQANGLATAMSLPEPTPIPPAPMEVPMYTGTVQSSICVKGLPSNADRLWMYEHFAKYGAVIGLRILIDEATGLCKGTGFVSYGEVAAADKAQQALHGVLVGEFPLSISVQQHPRPAQGGALTDSMTNGGMPQHDWQMARQRTAPQLW
jgi:RNA recognition motif. (a.k.a. RRM, RBD, or RNP domain)